MKLMSKQSGFTLPEFLISSTLLIVIVSGVMITYFRCLELNEISSNTSIAVLAAKDKMAEIENTAFTLINGNYDNVPFTINGFNGMGVTYVDDSQVDILTVTTVVSWQQTNGRQFGEDTNLNGVLNGGEDTNANGQLDSIVQFETQLFNI